MSWKSKGLCDEVAQMPKNDHDEITEVSGEQDVIRRFLDGSGFESGTRQLFCLISILVVCAVPKFRVHRGERLFGRGGFGRHIKGPTRFNSILVPLRAGRRDCDRGGH
jgi:hypothetical protein